MKIAIHHREGSFSDYWIEYCLKNDIQYKIVNAFDSNIIEDLKDCNALMWHHHPAIFKDVVTAKRILFALEHAGIKVFPNFRTGWHFDDKVAQKYLLEAIGVPLVPSYIFYDKKEAIKWAKRSVYPKVFKLKGGAGAANVQLAKNQAEALKLIKKSFGKGFIQFNRTDNLKERFNKFKYGQDNFVGVLKGVARLFIQTDFAKLQPPEKGYAYFQDFIPYNSFDIRVIVIGNRAFAIKRQVRPNDFRASGSGMIVYDPMEIDVECIKIAFLANDKINSQSIAFDFIFDEENNPLIVEISYGFAIDAYDSCPGYWDKEMNWNEEKFNPQEWMLINLINEVGINKDESFN